MGTLRGTDTDHEDYESKKNTHDCNKIHAKIYDKRKGQRIVFRSKHPEN